MSDDDLPSLDLSRDFLRRFLAPQSWDDLLGGERVTRRSPHTARREARAWTAFVVAAEDAGLIWWDARAERWKLTAEGSRQVMDDAVEA